MRTSAHVLAIFYLAVGIAPLFATQLGSKDNVLAKRQDTVASIKGSTTQEYRTIESHLKTHFENMNKIQEWIMTVYPNNPSNHPLMRHLTNGQLETSRHHGSYETRRHALNRIPD
ncbi:hypothetical protein F5148DRAFT_1189914 [Russula earlei]|uniref:Uncharacterized protein n=1 Tax=Russula earlei TaxID=71964 RepID=A0ACC0UDI6_9AGAM|nr:hypothetical protein F5148DRAFT_1189914 [Russula earlei]